MLYMEEIPLPTWEHFHAADDNDDDELTLEEWKLWAHVQ